MGQVSLVRRGEVAQYFVLKAAECCQGSNTHPALLEAGAAAVITDPSETADQKVTNNPSSARVHEVTDVQPIDRAHLITYSYGVQRISLSYCNNGKTGNRVFS